ncbi:MAG: hypothetical protein FJZ38_14655 [Candidatus Rokubacteria bacterium]|nr:hypothetical protein [Candidatus Rokubacteria bacterium]
MRRPASRLPIVAALLLAAMAMLLQLGSVPHHHAGAESGLYNQEHDLTLLAGLAGHVVEAAVVPVVTLDAASAALPCFTPACRELHVARTGAPRAPPAA